MKTHLIDTTPRYTYERIDGKGREQYSTGNTVRAFYLHQGKVHLVMARETVLEDMILLEGQGFIATPNVTYFLESDRDIVAVQSSAPVRKGENVIEIVDDGTGKREVPLEGYRIITNPKRVDKPWGHELWICWLRDHHVLKQIGMKAGNRSSLQLHRNKLETNYLIEGEADVIDRYPIDLSLSEDAMKEAVRNVHWEAYMERKKPSMHWTSRPGIVHRVIAATDYLAYETSTPELDDVIRLSDDLKRPSGRIDEEHRRS